jgi:putative methionine-R-sulfoxide reductase with GAF domain
VNRTIEALAAAVDSAAPREQRAREAAAIVKNADRAYRWVGIYDVGDDEVALISHSGEQPSSEAVRTGATVVAGPEVIVPILGAESGIVIGTLDVQSDRIDAFSSDAVAFLEECAAKLRPLYD